MAIRTVQDMFIDSLRDAYDAEKQLAKALPKMAKAASSDELKQAFTGHLETTKQQIERLERIFESMELRTRGKTCEAMKGLVEEAKEMMEEIENPQVRDAALIAAAQKAEHYEIASYGSLAAFAQALGKDEAAQLLHQTLEEEKQTDQNLNQIALSSVNPRALEAAQQAAE